MNIISTINFTAIEFKNRESNLHNPTLLLSGLIL